MKKYTKEDEEKLGKLNQEGLSPKEILEYFPGRSYSAIRSKLVNMKLKVKETDTGEETTPFEKKLIKFLESKSQITVLDLANRFDIGPNTIKKTLDNLYDRGYNLKVRDGEDQYIELRKESTPEPPLKISIKDFFNKEIKFGAIADTHLGSKYERMDILNILYDIFQKENINVVLHGGNYVDGEFYFNKYETYTKGFDEMIDNFIEKYPQREGIKTHFISGDDHEGWWMQREGLDAGRVVVERAKEAGREDLVYLGYQERDLVLKNKKGSALLRIMHAGGGTAYADSYSTQKMVESFAEGEKPHILLVGHYHKSIYHTPRGIHVIQLGTTQDQTKFMRKKKLRAHMGGWIVTLNQAETGEINRFQPEWIHFWNKEFYRLKEEGKETLEGIIK